MGEYRKRITYQRAKAGTSWLMVGVLLPAFAKQRGWILPEGPYQSTKTLPSIKVHILATHSPSSPARPMRRGHHVIWLVVC